MKLKQLRTYIIKPALDAVGLWSLAAENLLVGTCIKESLVGLYVKQTSGPALGPYQHEPATYIDDIAWVTFDENLPLKRRMLAACSYQEVPPLSHLMHDWRWATLMCRLHYWRFEEPLPKADDIKGLASYWKRYYNTLDGKGKEEDYVRLYEAYHVKQ